MVPVIAISPVRDWRSTPPASQVLPSLKSRDTKTRKDIKNQARLVKESAVIYSSHSKMADETNFEDGRISNFQRHVSLTLDWTIWHTVVHHSSTSIYSPNFIWIGETFCGRTYVRMYCMYVWMDRQTLRTALFYYVDSSLGGVDLIIL